MKIEKLTKEQEEQIPEYIDKWVKLASKPIDKQKAIDVIEKLYELAKQKKPNIIFCESPKEACKLAKTKLGKNTLPLSYYWYDWAGYYDYAKNIGVKFDEENFSIFQDFVINCPFVLIEDNSVYVSEKPAISWEDKKLHSEDDMAIKYPDGYGFYFLKGINFEKELWEGITNKTLPAKKALTIDNIEKRIVAMDMLGGEKIIKELGGKIINEHADEEYGTLYELDIKDSLDNNYKYLKAIDPSKGKPVYLRVHPDCKTVIEAHNFCYKLDRFNISYDPDERT